jgi:hypothetical protein
MPFEGLSAASAPEVINKTEHNIISRGSILDTSNEITARHPAAAWVGAVSRHSVAR